MIKPETEWLQKKNYETLSVPAELNKISTRFSFLNIYILLVIHTFGIINSPDFLQFFLTPRDAIRWHMQKSVHGEGFGHHQAKQCLICLLQDFSEL